MVISTWFDIGAVQEIEPRTVPLRHRRSLQKIKSQVA